MNTIPNGHMAEDVLNAGRRANDPSRDAALTLVGETCAALLNVLDLIAASQLAANGELDEAKRLLSRHVSSSTPNETLDLLARVLVKKGEFDEARQLWLTILERGPDNQDARDALARLHTHWLAIAVAKRLCLLAALSVTLALAAVGILSLSGLQFYAVGSPPAALLPFSQEEPVPASPVKMLVPPAQTFTSDTNIPTSFEIGSDDQSEQAMPRLPPFFAVSNATVLTNMLEARVIFDEGLFSYRCELTESARARLDEAGRAIAEHAPNCWIIVEGHTDSEPLPATSPFRDNYILGLHRAVAAVAVLKTTPIPKQDVLVASAGDQHPIFPGDDQETKLKNRTVVIRLLPKTTVELRTGEDPL